MKKKLLKAIALIGASCILFTGCDESEAETLKVANVTPYSKNDLEKTMIVNGVVESAVKDSVITTELTEYKVTALHYKLGDYVNAGDIVCELDTTELEKEIAELEKEIADSDELSNYRYQQMQEGVSKAQKKADLDLQAAQKKIDDEQANRDTLQQQYEENMAAYNEMAAEIEKIREQMSGELTEEQRELYDQQYATMMETSEQFMMAYETAQAQIRESDSQLEIYKNAFDSLKIRVESDIDSAIFERDTYSLQDNASTEKQKELDELREKLENTKVKAERGGVISNIAVEVGKKCESGLIMTIQSTDDICIHTVISEEDLLSVESGMRAVVEIKAKSDEEFEGKVDRVLDIKTNDGFDGYIKVDDTKDFRIGMNATVEIFTIDEKDVLSVSRTSVFKNDEEQDCVYKATENDDGTYKIEEIPVETGLETIKYTEVKSSELSEGDYIVSTPSKFDDGEIVEVKVKSTEKEGE